MVSSVTALGEAFHGESRYAPRARCPSTGASAAPVSGSQKVIAIQCDSGLNAG